MWFKNLQLYRFTKPFEHTAETLETALQQRTSRLCGPHEEMSHGWSSPLGRKGEMLVHAANNFLMICATKEEKIIPASVVREYVNERVDKIEDTQARKVRKKERDNIRDDVMTELLPRALSRTLHTFAYIDLKEGWLVVDSASVKKAEEFTALLRKTIGSLPVVPPTTNESPHIVLTEWLTKNNHPAEFGVEDECELRAADAEGSIVRCKRQDLGSPEIQAHLKAGKQVAKMALNWRDRLTFVLDDSMAIKRVRFLDVIQEQVDDVETEDEAQRFDVDFSIMTLELSLFIKQLFEAFGGENVDALDVAA